MIVAGRFQRDRDRSPWRHVMHVRVGVARRHRHVILEVGHQLSMATAHCRSAVLSDRGIRLVFQRRRRQRRRRVSNVVRFDDPVREIAARLDRWSVTVVVVVAVAVDRRRFRLQHRHVRPVLVRIQQQQRIVRNLLGRRVVGRVHDVHR